MLDYFLESETICVSRRGTASEVPESGGNSRGKRDSKRNLEHLTTCTVTFRGQSFSVLSWNDPIVAFVKLERSLSEIVMKGF